MKLSHLKIKNFKCIENWEFEIEDYISIIGPNNSGKSTTLRAIQLFLNGNKPEPDEWPKGTEDQPIVIEGVFSEIEEWEKDIPGISSLIYNNKINLKVTYTKDGNDRINTVYEAYVGIEEIEGWSDKWGELSDGIKEIAASIDIDGRGWKNKSNQERVRQAIRDEYSNLILDVTYEWTNEGISIDPALKQGTPHCELIPAILDASEEGKSGYKKTILKTLIEKAVLPSIYESEEYQEIMVAANRLASKMRGENGDQFQEVKQLADELTERVSSVINARIVLTMDSPDGEKIVNDNTLIKIDDGVETGIEYQGHGAQRALIFALIESLANQQSKIINRDNENSRPTILLFEEPELFIHPHLLRRLKNALVKLSEQEGWQVIATTHSPFLIDVSDNYSSLLITRQNNNDHKPEIFQLEENPFVNDEGDVSERDLLRAVLDFHPSVCEAFFAKRVLLVEGDSEIAFFQYSNSLLQLVGLDPDLSNDTTVVSCSGKWTILPIARLLNAFKIPIRIIHDIDKKGRTNQELQSISHIDPYNVNQKISELVDQENIFKVDDTFEDILWPNGNGSQTDKPYRAWMRTDEICNELNINDFPTLVNLINFSFDW